MTATISAAAIAGALQLTPWHHLAGWLLTGYAVVIAGRSVWRIVRELRSGTYGVDILAVTAIVAALVVGEVWAALVIVLMLTGGEALEDYASNRAQRDLSALLSRRPQTGHRLEDDGTTTEVPIDAISPGERVVVRPDEIVPVDGILISGSGTFDESSLTGESLPVERTAGQEVLSGGVNGTTAIVLKATRLAQDSQYQQIVTLVAEATASRAPMVRLADRFAIPFTAFAFVLAGSAWALSGDPVRLAEVLVVATPCPLIIAAPVAFMAGMSRAAREGIIVKSSGTLEALRRARSFAFDKTGTLTHGEPSLVDVRASAGVDRDELLRLAASTEQFSSHVLAASVVRAAQERGLDLSGSQEAEEVTAKGATALIEGRHVVVGRRSFVSEATGTEIRAEKLFGGEIAVYVALDGHPAGTLVFRDEVRANARSTIASIRSQGIEHVLLVTGDDIATARFVAAAVDITDVRAGCLPSDKVAAVGRLTERPVVMVGDGVNDAPVLAAADVGIAMGARGATASSETADVVLLRDDISCVDRTLSIGRATVDVALQSIGIGIGLSVALMLVAAFGLLPALLGAWLQEGVDVVSILWALRAIRGRGRTMVDSDRISHRVTLAGRVIR